MKRSLLDGLEMKPACYSNPTPKEYIMLNYIKPCHNYRLTLGFNRKLVEDIVENEGFSGQIFDAQSMLMPDAAFLCIL